VRRCFLQPRRIATIIIASGGLGLGCLALLGGCGDDSRTTGTMVQWGEKEQADLDDMRASMKAGRAAKKAEKQAETKAMRKPSRKP